MNIKRLFLLLVGLSLIVSCEKEEEEQLEFPYQNKDFVISWISHSPEWFSDIHFKDELNGVALTNFGTVYVTEDGGKNWDLVYTNEYITGYISNMEFVNGDLGFIAGGEEPNPDGGNRNGSFILRTTDGGRTWEHVFHADSSEIMNLSINDEGHIYATWLNRIYTSYDGGDSWQKSYFKPFSNLWALHFNSGNGYCGGSQGVWYKSYDNGQSWESRALDSLMNLQAIEFQDATGFISTSNWESPMMRSRDFGETWEKINVVRTSYSGDFQFLKKSRLMGRGSVLGRGGWANEKAGFIYSMDEGETWNEILFKSHTYFGEIYMYSDDEGYINGGSRLFKIRFK
jgi:photosystem II stability/assembly factor-like uncharacterized protein